MKTHIYTKRDLERVFRKLGLPPTGKAAKAAWERHQVREAQNSSMAPPTLKQRFSARITNKFRPVIRERGGETRIREKNGFVSLSLQDHAGGCYLLYCSGWRHYSNKFGSRAASLSYLCGHDDSGDWALRLPGTITTIYSALDWITPAQVKRALAAGKRVVRQGDVYAVETRGADSEQRLGSHKLENGVLVHISGEHAPVSVPFPAKLYQQKMYAMGRGMGRGSD